MKQILLKTWLIIACLLVGGGTTWAEDVTYVMQSYNNNNNVYTATDGQNGVWSLSASCSTSNQLPANWSQTGASSRGICFGTPNNVTVTSQNSFTNVTKIVVEASSNSDTPGTIGLSVGTTSLESKNLGKANHSTYEFTSATPLSGQITLTVNQSSKSVWIGGLKVTTSTGGSTPTPTSLSVPTNLSSSNVTTTGATLSWDAVTNASSYTVKIGETEHTGVNTTSYSATGLTAGTQYTWTVKAIGDGVSYSSSAYAENANFSTESDDSETASFIFNTDTGLSALGIAKPATNNGTNLGSSSYTSGPISMTATDGGTATRVWSSNPTTLRVYNNGGSLTFSGATITKIVFTGTVPMDANVGNFSEKTWTGEATSVTFTATSSVTINTIEITYKDSDEPQKTTPTLSFSESTCNATIGEAFTVPTLTNSQNVTVTYSSSNTSAATVNSSTGAIELVGAGTTTITASFAGDETYNEASASYNLNVASAPLSTMDEIFAAATTAGSTPTEVRVKFTNWVISGLNGTKNAYLTDNNGKGLIIFDNGGAHGLETGDILSGTVTCNVQLYNGSAELTGLKSNTTGLTITKGGSTTEQNIAIADLAGVNTGALIAYENLTYHLNGSSAEFSDGENVIVAYKGIMNQLPELVEGKTYDIKGIFLMYGTKKEILPRTTEDIVLKEAINHFTISYAATENGTIVVKNGDTPLAEGDEVAEGATLTIECTPTDAENYRFSNWQYKVGEGSWNTRYTNPQDYTMPSANVQFKANFEKILTYTVAFSVNGAIVKTEDLKDGAAVTAPSIPEDINGKTFTGWVETPTVDADKEPSYVNPSTTAEKTVTYYAVFATYDSDATSDQWLTTNLSDLTSSDVFVMANGTNAISTSVKGTSPTAVILTVNEGKITSEVTDDLKWTLTGNATDGYTFYKNGSTDYLYVNTIAETRNNTCIRVGTQNSNIRNKWKPTADGYLKTSDSFTARYLSFYSENSDFRGYVNTDNGVFVPTFYKLIPGEEAYCDFTTIPEVTYTSAGTINFVANDGEGNYYATFSSDNITAFPTEPSNDVTLYVEAVKVGQLGVISKKDFETDFYCTNEDMDKVIIPANTAVLLHAFTTEEKAPSIAYEYTNAESEIGEYDPELNMLVPCSTTGIFKAETDGNFYFKLAYGDNTKKTKLGFWYGAEDGSGNFNVKAGGAVLCVPQSMFDKNAGGGVKGFCFDMTGEETAITQTLNNVKKTDAIYNLQGVKLQKLQTGINIVNGRKVIR